MTQSLTLRVADREVTLSPTVGDLRRGMREFKLANPGVEMLNVDLGIAIFWAALGRVGVKCTLTEAEDMLALDQYPILLGWTGVFQLVPPSGPSSSPSPE